VQLGAPVKPVTEKVAGVASDALADPGLTEPEVQVSETVTAALMLGTKSLTTVNVAEFRLFVIVQVPTLRVAEQVAVEV
jgi:hypothetical protein